ncbi:excalibur calcium-binding domain-containing protein [Corynebacterium simulans]|uniref:excalibur calcium-binding domain-containing protein n=1 Tax=Corynebacterium simulans TaxID=146827 RepID=UPI0009EE6990|nr:excalibur calcium-binding domain-containing protein [Corynebacterium simulans]
MSRSLGLMVTTLGAATLLVGCGGGDSDSQPTSEPTTTATTSQTTISSSSSATSTTSSSTPASEGTPSPTEPAAQLEVSPAQVTEETVQQQEAFLAPPAGVDANVDPDAGAYVEQPAPEAPAVEEQQAPAPAPAAAYYPNCAAVRAAGAAPIYAGDPGYSSDLDHDGDGVACEK